MSTTYSHERQFSRVDDRKLIPFPTQCPPWCAIGNGTSRGYHLDYEPTDALPQGRVHEGPTFGAVTITGLESINAPGIVHISADVHHSRRADLRQLAADARAAADWIEAQA